MNINILRLPYLLWRGVGYHLPERWSCNYPVLVNFLVTRRCNSRCLMCSIWKTGNRKEEMSLSEIDRIFSSRLFKALDYISLAGGEPFLRDDIADIASTVYSRCDKLNGMSIFTNGFLTGLIEKRLIEVLNGIDTDRLKEFLVSVSIDGIGQVHDEIRGVEGGFEKAAKTLKVLKKMSMEYSFTLQMNTVIQKSNIDMLDDIWMFAADNGVRVHFVPVRLANFVFSNLDRRNKFEIEPDQLDILKKFVFGRYLKDDNSPLSLFWLDYFRMAEGKERKVPCLWNSYAVALNADGTLFPCEASSTFVYGNALEADPYDIWCSEKSREARTRLRDSFCKRCTLECTSDGAMYREFFRYSAFLLKRKLAGKKSL